MVLNIRLTEWVVLLSDQSTRWSQFKSKNNHLINPSQYTSYKLHNGGLFNQLISLETAVGISSILNSNILVHSAIDLSSHSSSWEYKPVLISDVIDIDSISNVIIQKEPIKNKTHYQTQVDSLMNKFITVLDSNNNIESFKEGREQLILNPQSFYYIENTLSYYSIMFFNRTSDFDNSIKSVKFKNEYIDLAEKIAESLNNFCGLHVRLTDFTEQIHSASEKDISYAYLLLLKNNMPIVLSSDDNHSKKIELIKDKVIFLEDYIKQNFMKEFLQLTIPSKITFDLINLLVMTHSKDFIGTIGSTYSGYIHRSVNQKKNNSHHFKNIGDFENANGFPFSWNSYGNIPISKRLWWREWRESYYV
jgi:hypothetical protein